MKRAVILIIFIFFLGGLITNAENDRDSIPNLSSILKKKAVYDFTHGIGINSRPSYIIPTHGFYNGWNPTGKPLRMGGSFHLDYSFSCSDDSESQKRYLGVYQGLGLGVQTLGSHKYIGTPILLYIFQGAPLVKISETLTLGYEWNFGLGAGWKVNEQMLAGSSVNLYVNVGLMFNWQVHKDWDIIFGPEYTHFSNGDTKFPNAGANTVNFRIGARRLFGRDSLTTSKPELFRSDNQKKKFSERITYDLTAFGAWRADRMLINNRLHIIDNKFLVAGFQFNPLYHLNKYFSVGPSLDLLYDRSSNLIASVDENEILTYEYPGFFRQCAAGLSARGEIRMPIFAVNIGIGYNFCQSNSNLKGLYGLFSLKTFMTDSLYLNIGYRLGTVLYAHNLMFGLGWRFH